jgi:hypothetical protein
MGIEVVSVGETKETVTVDNSAEVTKKAEATAQSNEATSASTDENQNDENTSEDSETTDSEDTDTDDGENDGKEAASKTAPKKKGGWQRKIDKLSREKSQAEQEKEFWRQEALKTKRPDSEKVDEPAKTQAKDDKPNPDDYASHEEYLDARDEWRDKKRIAAETEKAKETSLKADFESKQEKHIKRLEEYKAKHADFDDLMQDFAEDAKGMNIPAILEHTVMESEFGPQLLHEFANNRKELERILALDPIPMIREIGRIEARFEKSSEEPTKTAEVKTTKAPKPISTVGSGSGTAAKKSIFEAGSQAEYEAIRKEQMKNRNSAWG